MRLLLPLALITNLITTSSAHPAAHKSHWENLPSLPLPRQEHTTVYIPSTHSIYVLGGIIFNPDTNASFPVITTGLLQSFSLHTSTWTTLSPLPKAMNHINAASVSGKLFVLGGLADNPSTGNWDAVPNCYVYDPSSNKWSETPSMPTKQARGSSAAAVNEGIIYLAGGMRRLELSGNFTQDTVGTVTAYDTRNGEWKVLPSLPDGRDHAGAAVYGDNFFVVGGRYRGQMNVRGTVFSLSLRRSEKGWSSRSPMPTPRGGLAAGLVGGKLYTFGGEGNPAEGSKGVFNETEAYDVRTDHWMRLPPMPVPRHGTSAVAVNGKIYIPGGGVEQGGGPVAMFDVFVP